LTWKLSLAVYGVVQGVGFRPFVARLAREYGLAGYVRNEGGRVSVMAYGEEPALLRFAADVETRAPGASRIIRVSRKLVPMPPDETPPEVFAIGRSAAACGPALPAPDIALCGDCLRELFTPGDPRYHNPFISCAHCGPRYTVLRRLPYDRQNTAMDAFPLCALCESQYAAPADRRYHAQTLCCNACGPRLRWRGARGEAESEGDGALADAANALCEGAVIAVKGIGGYHLACDAKRADSVAALRALKGRESKPFAVMFPTLDAIKAHCFLNAEEEAALSGPERPIVLLRRKAGSAVAPDVYGTSPYLGAFLPYTPLQCLLLNQTGPLVMTSANRSGLPIIRDDADALRLSDAEGECRGVLYHNRMILRRADDSVVFENGGQVRMLRRARGFVPLPVAFGAEGGAPVLALGAQQKSTVCLAAGAQMYPSVEIGDLDTLETQAVYRDTVEEMQALLGIRPETVACDEHPGYESTRFARLTGLPVVTVQHHFAHIASVLAETGRRDRVIGVAFDGTGYGPDGTVWGGEFLLASPFGFERAGHLKALRFLGGDESVRQGWKSAASLLFDAGLLRARDDPRYPALLAALNGGCPTVRSSSMGRVFDGVSSLLGFCHVSGYEGQGAVELENAAALAPRDENTVAFPFGLREEADGLTVDTSPCIRALTAQRDAGENRYALALRFHNTVCRLIVDACVAIRKRCGLNTVALSGGVFQNRLLLDRVPYALTDAGFEVLTNRLVPAGDGGVSLGQAYVARLGYGRGEETGRCASPLTES
jgi:hydrogenase maturation protein HypF